MKIKETLNTLTLSLLTLGTILLNCLGPKVSSLQKIPEDKLWVTSLPITVVSEYSLLTPASIEAPKYFTSSDGNGSNWYCIQKKVLSNFNSALQVGDDMFEIPPNSALLFPNFQVVSRSMGLVISFTACQSN